MIYLELLWTFFKIGAFTFGGGYVMIPLIQAEAAAHGWMDAASLVNFIAVSESTPGPLAVNVATYIGAEIGGIFGAVCATFGVIVPAFATILIVAKSYEKFKASKLVKGCMSGLKPAVVGLIGTAVISIGTTVFFPKGFYCAVFSNVSFYVTAAIFGLSLYFALKNKSPILIICISAILGIAAGYFIY